MLPERVPAMKVIRADFKTADILLEDERGLRVGFHALRLTYIARLQRAGVSPREAMELARCKRHASDDENLYRRGATAFDCNRQKLTSFNDTQIDTQTLDAGGHFVPPSVIGLKAVKVDKTIGNIGGNHGASSIVTFSHENENGGERGIRTPNHRFFVQSDRLRQSESGHDFHQCFQWLYLL